MRSPTRLSDWICLRWFGRAEEPALACFPSEVGERFGLGLGFDAFGIPAKVESRREITEAVGDPSGDAVWLGEQLRGKGRIQLNTCDGEVPQRRK